MGIRKHATGRVVLFSIVLFAIMSVVYLAAAYWAETSSIDAQREKMFTNQQDLVDTERTVITSKIDRLTDDLIYVRDSLKLNTADGGDPSSVIPGWIAFADSQKIYDQIRFIDVNGNEVIRVNYNADGSYAVSADQLQNKADRYYFSDSIGIGEDQIYISKLDLNIEGSEIEQPIKPMIRLCIPYYDDAGTLQGIVCLNYLAKDMLSSVSTVANAGVGEVYLLNADGYWLFNEVDRNTAWAFMYDDRADISFANSFPDEWSRMANLSSGEFLTQNGLFAFTKSLTSTEYLGTNRDYSIVLGEGDWTVVSQIPAEGEYAEMFVWGIPQILLSLVKRNIFVLVLLLAFSCAIAFILDRNRSKKERVKYFSEYDEMTGILNRRAGLERLEQTVQRRRGEDTRSCVCFIDINGLKNVNDTYGHEAGDELILAALDVMKRSIRDRDFIVRMGGDEFVIVFNGLDITGAEKVWRRINDEYVRVNESGVHRFPISASHGLADLVPDKPIDDAINRADELMYEEKHRIKSQAVATA